MTVSSRARAVDGNDEAPGLGHSVNSAAVECRRRPSSLQITVKDAAVSAATWRRLQVRARPVGGRHDDHRTRVRLSRRQSQRNRKSRACLLRLHKSQVRHSRPHYRAPLGCRLHRSKTTFILFSSASEMTYTVSRCAKVCSVAHSSCSHCCSCCYQPAECF